MLVSTEAASPTSDAARRTPAEWEPQAAVWLQWPFAYEGADVQTAFVDIVAALVDYEDVHIVVDSPDMQTRALQALAGVDLERVELHRR